MIMYDGKTMAMVATSPPKIPAVVNPANVATFTPTGPGVTEEIAIIFVSCSIVYQLYFSAMWYRNGSVEYPPPKENNPI